MIEKGKIRDWAHKNGCELLFYKCTNVTPKAVAEACGNLLKKAPRNERNADIFEPGRNSLKCSSTERRLLIHFHFTVSRLIFCICIQNTTVEYLQPFHWNILPDPEILMLDDDTDEEMYRRARNDQLQVEYIINPLVRNRELYGYDDDDGEDDGDDDEKE